MELTNKHSGTTHRVSVRRITAAGVVAVGLSAFVLAPDAARAASSTATKTLVISTATNSKYGTILVSGRTLYTLKPSGVACTAKCLKVWPEVLLPKGVKKATAGHGVTAAKLGTVTAGWWNLTGDLLRQGALLVLQRHRARAGEGSWHRHVGNLVGCRDEQAEFWLRWDNHYHESKWWRRRVLAPCCRRRGSSCRSSSFHLFALIWLGERRPGFGTRTGRASRCVARVRAGVPRSSPLPALWSGSAGRVIGAAQALPPR